MHQPNENVELERALQYRRVDGPRRSGKAGDAGKSDELRAIESALKERLKELRCLYGITELIESHSDSLPRILEGIVDLLPTSWQYPELCRAQVQLYSQRYVSADFSASHWRQSAAIQVQGQAVGAVDVFYLREMPPEAEGPFLKEERDLIDAIAERIGRTVERFQVEKQLEIDRAALQEANMALRRVLAEIEQEKARTHESISANVEKIFMPILRALESEIPAQQRKYVALLKEHLTDICSPFALSVSKACGKLTPVEIEICDMVRNGMSTKEIARLRHVAPATVSKQRERIRRKLDIAKTETNLATHLQMLSAEQNSRSYAIFN